MAPGQPDTSPADTRAQSRLQRAVLLVERDAADSGLSRRVARTAFWTPVVGGLALVAIYVVVRPLFYTLTREDNLIEWLQFAICLFTALVAAVTAGRLLRRGRVVLAVVLLLVAVCTAFLAGEEISWGQRVFALLTPDGLSSVNAQAEINVHNITPAAGISIQGLFKAASFLMGLGGLVLAVVGLRVRGGRFWRYVVPPLCAVPGFLGIVLYWPIAHVLQDNSPVVRLQEWVELSLFTSVALTVVCVGLRTVGPVGDATGTGGRGTGGTATRRTVVVLAAVVLVVTAVFAALTAYHGIIPVNARS